MPIEHERKLLLWMNKPVDVLRSLKALPQVTTFDITQGYISKSARIRYLVEHQSQNEQHVFTYKVKVAGATVEIEQEISIHDYHKLFLIAKPIIYKTRCKFKDGNNQWDIDFFKTTKSGEIYLVMAEVEMPEFEMELPEPHELIAPYVLKWIEKDDKRFQNRNLGNNKKIAKLLKDIGCSTPNTEVSL